VLLHNTDPEDGEVQQLEDVTATGPVIANAGSVHAIDERTIAGDAIADALR
jgi:hypothetical protein